MINYIFIFFILYANVSASSLSSEDLSTLRLTYYQSVEDENYLDTLRNYIQIAEDNADLHSYPLLLAYKGAIESVKAKHAFWPFTKMSYLNESMDTLAKAVSMDEDNLEIRFIRFSILHYVPGILGYSEELESDLTKIIELLDKEFYSGLPLDVVEGMSNFMVESERLNEIQLQSISKQRILSNNQ